ncbi:RiPP maturation radical SAM C-methyltransferase [Thermodesulfobacteriota bacterium]
MNLSPVTRHKLGKVALIAMPWNLHYRPSIQLGVLKAYLEQNGFSVETFHPYLEVAALLGTQQYMEIARNIWAAESLYAPIVFPDQYEKAERLFSRELPVRRGKSGMSFQELHDILDKHLRKWVEGIDWGRYQLAGVSICFSQFFSSLAVTSLLKQKYLDLAVAAGGSTCVPEVAESLICEFPQLDYVISGEGEQPLLNLCQYLAGHTTALSDRIHTKKKNHHRNVMWDGREQVKDLSELPIPAYDDYFAELQRAPGIEPFIPQLPVEFSRGCWWRKCAFCNLNLEWHGYRSKKAEQVAGEVAALSEQFGCLDFCFTDNALPVGESKRFFQKMAVSRKDWNFFGEIRVNQKAEVLAQFKRGGLSVVQAGIEALSDGLLKRLRKGASVIENIAAMRDAVACGMVLEGNLIIEFPGSTRKEVDETLETLDYVLPFHPLTTAIFFLGLGSPVHCRPDEFGIRAVVPHRNNKQLFPGEVLNRLVLLINDYRGDRAIQRRLWRPVIRKVKYWHDFHRSRQCSVTDQPILSYRDGGGYLILRQENPGGTTLHHRLKGLSRDVYLFCLEMKSIDQLLARFDMLSREGIEGFLQDLLKKKIMYTDGSRYLSLAVRKR